MSDEGGDAACWLDRACDECGAIIDDDHDHRCRSVREAAADVTSSPHEERHDPDR